MTDTSITVRDTCDADLPAITDIYNDAVVNTVAVWNNDTVDVGNRRDWLRAHQIPGTAALTAVDADGRVLGYATYGEFRHYDGFRDTVENSVYVAADARTGGVGTALMAGLLTRARAGGAHVMVAAIESGNTASLKLHEKLGFATVGILLEVGTKFGRRLGMTLMQVFLD
ncbi:GNAT family N-acetyltransferase [uncultured Corynebacterium sp.]|uniref:GNAT family N-acetyltransferase n=1 Tax=uncultured Corynebacterium sp. TaxID=159447 RepID=UPI0025FAC9C9|nr:GNAT family N-acetyltransferase [uncultured Corynebacterium sp.]